MPFLFGGTFGHLHAFSSTSVLHPLTQDNSAAKTKLRASATNFFDEADVTDVSGYHPGKAPVFSHTGPGAQLDINTVQVSPFSEVPYSGADAARQECEVKNKSPSCC